MATTASSSTNPLLYIVTIQRVFKESLARLKTDKVKIFYLVTPDSATPIESTLSDVQELHDEGLFEEFGLSNFSAWQVAEASPSRESPTTNSYSLPHPRDRRLFVGAAIGTLVVVFAGFARTYFLKFLYHTPALPWLVHLHGAVMTSWFLLFFAQTSLIARHRADLHRRLGTVGAVLVVVMVVLGMIVIASAATREVHAHAKDAPFFLMLLARPPSSCWFSLH